MYDDDDKKDKYPWVPKTIFFACMAVAAAFIVTAWVLD